MKSHNFLGNGSAILAAGLFGARHLLKIKPNDLPFLILLGAIFFAIFPVTFNIGYRHKGIKKQK